MKIKYDQIMALDPCYDPADIGMPKDYDDTLANFIEDYRDKVKNSRDIVWVLMRSEFFGTKDLILFAVWCARQVQHLMQDECSIEALDVAERFAFGLATRQELDNARAAARDAWDAAYDAASASASYALAAPSRAAYSAALAAYDAALAAYDAAYIAYIASDAAYADAYVDAASDTASYAAAYAAAVAASAPRAARAARADADSAQIDAILKMIKAPNGAWFNA